MAKVFIYDESGKVVETKEKGKGRHPIGSILDEAGDLHIHPKNLKIKTQYVTITENGEVTKESKSRGRTRLGYILATDGEYIGHYVKDERNMMSMEVVEETKEVVEEPVE